MKVKVDEILRELDELWEAGSLPGRQQAELNAVLRALWQALQQQPPAPAPVRLRVVRDHRIGGS